MKKQYASGFDKNEPVLRRRQTGVITTIKRFSGKPHDINSLDESLAQNERLKIDIRATQLETENNGESFMSKTKVEKHKY